MDSSRTALSLDEASKQVGAVGGRLTRRATKLVEHYRINCDLSDRERPDVVERWEYVRALAMIIARAAPDIPLGNATPMIRELNATFAPSKHRSTHPTTLSVSGSRGLIEMVARAAHQIVVVLSSADERERDLQMLLWAGSLEQIEVVDGPV